MAALLRPWRLPSLEKQSHSQTVASSSGVVRSLTPFRSNRRFGCRNNECRSFTYWIRWVAVAVVVVVGVGVGVAVAVVVVVAVGGVVVGGVGAVVGVAVAGAVGLKIETPSGASMCKAHT